MINTEINKKRVRNSVKLSTVEHQQLKEYYETFHTDLDFAEAFKIDRTTLKRVMFIGSGKEHNIQKIQKKLKKIFA